MISTVLDWTELNEADREAAMQWVRSFGLEPTDVSVHFEVLHVEHGWELRLNEFKRNAEGHRYIESGNDAAAVNRHVFAVDPASWPAFVTRATTEGAAA